MKTKYSEALDYLYGFTNYEKQSGFIYSPERFDLARVDRLLTLLGEPHRAFDAVHIAGTKGKGSTAAMTAAILRAAGYRTALYTSPHLHTVRERIRTDGEISEKETWADGVTHLYEKSRDFEREGFGAFSKFEALTALAAHLFAQAEVDCAVYEVGRDLIDTLVRRVGELQPPSDAAAAGHEAARNGDSSS